MSAETTIAELRLRADAYEAAARTATMLAVREGATQAHVERTVAAVHRAMSAEALNIRGADAILDAGYQLRCRREMCGALITLALEHGVTQDEVEHALIATQQTVVQMSQVTTVADLGLFDGH